MVKKTTSPVAVDQIDGMIRVIRGVRVMLDRDLAKTYGVSTKAFNQAVNAIERVFPRILCFGSPK
jgi:ORF6N domain